MKILAKSLRHKGSVIKNRLSSLVVAAFPLLLALNCQFIKIPQAAASETAEATQSLKSGKYEGLMFAVDRVGNVSGHYRETQGQGVVKTCDFFFKGKVDGDRAELSIWGSQMVPGLLTADGANVKLQIKDRRNLPGCDLVLLPEVEQGMTLEKTTDAKWRAVGQIATGRASLYSDCLDSTKLKSYLIVTNVVGVLYHDSQWVQIEYLREGKSTISGWVKASDIQIFQ